jgi:FMN phosphatase YigB (HAD superfamily)
MARNVIVTDFDGTVTDVDKGAKPYIEGYQRNVADTLGIARQDLLPKWQATQAVVEANPSQYGWVMNGRIIAPAYADPLIMGRTVAHNILDEAGICMDPEERHELLEGFFQENYPNIGTVFRPDTQDYLKELYDHDSVVVTNSRTAKVEGQLAMAQEGLTGFCFGFPVMGEAKKYRLDDSWTEVPESVDKGFGRPLFLRRKLYWDVLQTIMDVTVIGDVYELDLLLPQHMGMEVILLTRPQTPQFEIDAVRSNGHIAQSLTEVVDILKKS